MLGRTANGTYWMARYLERAENTARLIEAGFRMALTRDAETSQGEWRSVITTMGQTGAFEAAYGTDYAGERVWNYLLRDRGNPGSVLAMIEAARSNARSVRTALTREVWEAINEAWMVLKEALARPVREVLLGQVLATIRRQATLVRGAFDGTMLRNEAYNFSRLGTFIERGDSTARILDVKYYVLLPSLAWVGSSLDNVQWESLLHFGDLSLHVVEQAVEGRIRRFGRRGPVFVAQARRHGLRSAIICRGQIALKLADLRFRILGARVGLGQLGLDLLQRLNFVPVGQAVEYFLE